MESKNLVIGIIVLLFVLLTAVGSVLIYRHTKEEKNIATNTDAVATESDSTETDATESDATITDAFKATYTDTIVETPTDTNAVVEEETTTQELTTLDTTELSTTVATEIDANQNTGNNETQLLEGTIEDIPNPTTTEEPKVYSPAISDYEFSLLCQVVECETHGADQVSKGHIVHVIRNRIYRKEWGSTWSTVILEPYQFGRRSDVTQSTIDAVNIALNSEDTTYGAIAFHSGGYSSTFFGYRYVFTDAVGHHFYI